MKLDHDISQGSNQVIDIRHLQRDASTEPPAKSIVPTLAPRHRPAVANLVFRLVE
ncbi:hypothetical protein ACFQUU_01925 [Herbaspirillum sp. GCM10030257]|uniref:hypothetical protein n=1 Tax=Herbaspirillum sp. GCM10030257 TaxID=3273393 RepID=UPI00361E144F